MSEHENRKHQRVGLLASLGIHGAMILLFVFVMGWKAPNPPLSEMGSGIELNFGLDDQGGGDIQPDIPPGNSEEQPQEDQQQSQSSSAKDQAVAEETPKTDAVKEDKAPDEKVLTGEEESPVTVKDPKKVSLTVKEKPLKPKTVDKKVVEKPVQKVQETLKDQKVTDVSNSKTVTDVKKGTPGSSQGDDPGKQGDKGSPQGKLDAKSLYGNPGAGGPGDGGGGGNGISVSGFVGFERPTIDKPEIPSDSYGIYSFSVKVNRDGEVISIKPITKGISLDAERIFKNTIENTEFIAKDVKLPAESEGIITFKVIPPPAKK